MVSTLTSLVASQVVKMTISDAAGGGRVASWRLFVFQSPGNTLHVLSQYTWQYITKFKWSMWLPNISLKSRQVRISQSMLNLKICFLPSYCENKGLFLLHSSGAKFVSLFYDDVIKWKHFPCYWPFAWGINRLIVDSPHKGQWRGALMFSVMFAWPKEWTKQSRRQWFETPSRSLWCHCNGMIWYNVALYDLIPY